MAEQSGGLAGKYDDVWLIDGVRAAFTDYNGALEAISPIDLGIDHAKYNVNGGAIAIGHPLGATGVRISVTVARELQLITTEK